MNSIKATNYWIIVIGLVLIGASGCWYYVDDIKSILRGVGCTYGPCETTKQKNSWKTYHNEKYGFEFKYPSNLETSEFTGTTNSSEFDVNLVQEGDPIDAALRIFLNIPSSSYGPYNSLNEEVEVNKETIGVEKFYSFAGYANMQWQCQNGHTKGELSIKSCSAQKGRDIYQLYFIDTGKFSLADFDIMVRSFHF